MNLIELQQGTEAWHQHRATHFNASDAPAMLGISPYKTRTQLLREMATGITPEVDEATQRRFDDGHRFEELARPLAEKIIGQELFPVVGSEGKLSASFDGLTMDESICFEHKTLNKSLEDLRGDDSEYLRGHKTDDASILPEMYRAQMEQQLMVSGAGKCLFMATKWYLENKYNDDRFVDDITCWYTSDPDMRDRLLQGWTQFAVDLETYQHVEHTKKPKAEVCIELPALFVHAKGEITTHNMDEFGMALTAKLSEVRAIALVTDQDFSNAKEAAKKFRETAKAIALSKEAMLAQTETIGEAARKMDAWAKDLNQTALQLEKDVEREDKAKKEVMVLEGRQAYADHVAALEAEIKPIRMTLTPPNFAEALKGKRNYASMHDAIQTMLAGAKIEADAQGKDIRSKLAFFKTDSVSQYDFLFRDLQTIIQKPLDDLELIVKTRIDHHAADEAARLEAERTRMEAEAKAKAEKDAAEKMAAEEARIRAEERAKAEEEAKALAKVEAQCAAPRGAVSQPAPQARPDNVVVIEHQDVISAFMASRDLGKDSGRVRAILVEFVKFSEHFEG